MLLVARRVGEALLIGSDVEVKVVASSRSRVLLAVSAPREVDIRRIHGKSDNKEAASAEDTGSGDFSGDRKGLPAERQAPKGDELESVEE